jgi:hypothetical protein
MGQAGRSFVRRFGRGEELSSVAKAGWEAVLVRELKLPPAKEMLRKCCKQAGRYSSPPWEDSSPSL